jgi:hypothetical protein
MTEQQFKKRPGHKSLLLMFALIGTGGVGLLVASRQADSWFTAAFAGWLTAGLLGLLGWWSTRRALSSGDHRTFLRYTVGGMGARFLVCGVLTGVIAGTQVLEVKGFVTGLLVGIAVFISIEVGSLALAKRLVPGEGG